MPAPFFMEGSMRVEQQYREVLRLKREINLRLSVGTGFWEIRELALFLAGDKAYLKLKREEKQLMMLDCFFGIWQEEKKKLPKGRIETDIFHDISSLEELEKKYQRIKYCGLRIENAVPGPYVEQALEWLEEDKVSGIAVGKIFLLETSEREENLLSMARYLKQGGNAVDGLLLLQCANETLPGRESLLLEEADIWIDAGEWEAALSLLCRIKNPSQDIRGLKEDLERLRRVEGND